MSNHYSVKCLACQAISNGINHGDECWRRVLERLPVIRAMSDAKIELGWDGWLCIDDTPVDCMCLAFVLRHIACSNPASFQLRSEYADVLPADYPPINYKEGV